MDRNGVDEFVLAGMSGSRRDQPIEFIDSRKDVDVMLDTRVPCSFVSRRRMECKEGVLLDFRVTQLAKYRNESQI